MVVQEAEAFLTSFRVSTRSSKSTRCAWIVFTSSRSSSSSTTINFPGMKRKRKMRGRKKTKGSIDYMGNTVVNVKNMMWPSNNTTGNIPKIVDQTGFTWLPNQLLRRQDKQRDGLDEKNFVLVSSSDGNQTTPAAPVYYHTMDLDVGKSMLRILNTTQKQIVFSHFGTPIQISPDTGKMMYPTAARHTKATSEKQYLISGNSGHSSRRSKRPMFSNPILRYRYILDDERWFYYYKQLESFKERYNHTRVPDTASMKQYRKLAVWVRKQRWLNTRRDQGMRYNFLTDERKYMLDLIHFEFDVNIGWAESYRLLKEYFLQNGHTNVLQSTWKGPSGSSSSSSADDHEDDYDILPYWIPMQRKLYRMGKLSQDKIQLLNEIQFDWDPVQTKWEKRYHQLQDFVTRHGHSRIPREGLTKSLSLWCEQQRRMYYKTRSTRGDTNNDNKHPNSLRRILRLKHYHRRNRKDRIQKLNALNFEWKPLDKLWTIKFQQLIQFKKQYGHVNVPYWQPWNDEAESRPGRNRFLPNPLGVWCRSQRRQYQEWIQQQNDTQQSGRSSTGMTAERVKLLEQVGFDFQYNLLEELWQRNFHELKAFYEDYGHCRVPSGYKPNPKLANWVQQQRTQYSTSSISQERVDLLNSIKFCWAVFESQWEERYFKLCEYKNKYGHVDVTVREDPKLASWIATQRKQYKEYVVSRKDSGMSGFEPQTTNETSVIANKFNLLTQLGVRLDPYQDTWMQQYHALKKFKTLYGHCKVPRFYQPDPSLGMWVSNQRRKRKDGNLTEERESMLNELGFEWSLVKEKT
jgi:hypothetical protein